MSGARWVTGLRSGPTAGTGRGPAPAVVTLGTRGPDRRGLRGQRRARARWRTRSLMFRAA